MTSDGPRGRWLDARGVWCCSAGRQEAMRNASCRRVLRPFFMTMVVEVVGSWPFFFPAAQLRRAPSVSAAHEPLYIQNRAGAMTADTEFLVDEFPFWNVDLAKPLGHVLFR
jgi:hypothetical protein